MLWKWNKLIDQAGQCDWHDFYHITHSWFVHSYIAGPHHFSLWELKCGSTQLSSILQHIFNLSLKQEKILVLWKTCLYWYLRKLSPSCHEGAEEIDSGPHCITGETCSWPSSVCLSALCGSRQGVDDVVIYMQCTLSHLDGNDGTMNTATHPTPTSIGLIGRLSGRPQFVQLGSSLSDVVVSNPGTPQGTVLFPFLFMLYTSDFQYTSESCHL